MKKLVVCLLGMALTASVSMGDQARFYNAMGNNLYEEPANWEFGFLPTDKDDLFKAQYSKPTCICSSSNTVNNLRINEGGDGGVTFIMNGAWLTLLTNQWAGIAYNVMNSPSTLIMTDSTLIHLADTNTTGTTSANGHFNVGCTKTGSNAGEWTGTLIMDNSAMILTRGSLRMHQSTPNVTNLIEEYYYDLELNLRTNNTTITMSNGSYIDTQHMNNMDNGMIYLNTGSYITSRSTSNPQLDLLINNGWVVVDGTVLTPENKSDYIYVDYSVLRTYVGSGVVPMVTVPNVVGQAEATARTTITGVGLTVGNVTSNYSEAVELGNVISQNPAGGLSIVTNSPVDFVVSLGVESPASPYETVWTGGVTYGDAGTAPKEDYDNDGAENLYEYALNGDMQSAGSTGTDPVFVRGAGETFEYTVVQRTNDANLVYSVQSRPSLLSGDWTDAAYSVLSTTPLTGDFVTVKYSIPAASNIYVRLKITMPTP